MDDRAPRGAVALDVDPAPGVGPSDKVVQDQVEAQAWRNTVGSRVPQKRGTEPVGRHLSPVVLDSHLRDCIRRDRTKVRRLVDERVAGLTIAAARRRVEEPSHPGFLGKPSYQKQWR